MINKIDTSELKNFQNELQKKDWYLCTSISANYTITDNDNLKTFYVTTGSSTITITLPTAADNEYRVIEFIKIDSGSGKITVDGEGAETINGSATIDLKLQYRGIRIKSYGSGWYIVDVIGADGVSYKWDSLDNFVNIVTTDTVLDNLNYTAVADGIYEVHASITFYNDQANTTPQRFVSIKLKKDATVLCRSQHEIVDVTGGDDYITVSLNWMGAIADGEVLAITANCESNAVMVAYKSTSNHSHWLIKRYDNNLITTL